MIPPVLFCFLTFSYELAKLISKDLILSEETLKLANDIYVFYDKQFNDLCKLWNEYDNNEILEDEAKRRYYELKDIENSKLDDINKLTFVFLDKRIRKKAEKLAKNYLNTYLA